MIFGSLIHAEIVGINGIRRIRSQVFGWLMIGSLVASPDLNLVETLCLRLSL